MDHIGHFFSKISIYRIDTIRANLHRKYLAFSPQNLVPWVQKFKLNFKLFFSKMAILSCTKCLFYFNLKIITWFTYVALWTMASWCRQGLKHLEQLPLQVLPASLTWDNPTATDPATVRYQSTVARNRQIRLEPRRHGHINFLFRPFNWIGFRAL